MFHGPCLRFNGIMEYYDSWNKCDVKKGENCNNWGYRGFVQFGNHSLKSIIPLLFLFIPSFVLSNLLKLERNHEREEIKKKEDHLHLLSLSLWARTGSNPERSPKPGRCRRQAWPKQTEGGNSHSSPHSPPPLTLYLSISPPSPFSPLNFCRSTAWLSGLGLWQ